MLQPAMTERRCRRSETPHEALAYWLESLAQRYGARGMAVSTLDGLPVAACGEVDGPLLAACGAVIAAGGPPSQDTKDLDTTVVTIPANLRLVLTAMGSRCPSHADVAADIGRILA